MNDFTGRLNPRARLLITPNMIRDCSKIMIRIKHGLSIIKK
jgi:hypothetical protein